MAKQRRCDAKADVAAETRGLICSDDQPTAQLSCRPCYKTHNKTGVIKVEWRLEFTGIKRSELLPAEPPTGSPELQNQQHDPP